MIGDPLGISTGLNQGRAQVLGREPGVDYALAGLKELEGMVPDPVEFESGEYWDADHQWMRGQTMDFVSKTAGMEKAGLDPMNPRKRDMSREERKAFRQDRQEEKGWAAMRTFQSSLEQLQKTKMLSMQQKDQYETMYKVIHSDPVWSTPENQKKLEEWRAIADPVKRAAAGVPKFNAAMSQFNPAERTDELATLIKNPDQAASYFNDPSVGALISRVDGEFSETRQYMYGKIWNMAPGAQAYSMMEYDQLISLNPQMEEYYKEKSEMATRQSGTLVSVYDVYASENYLKPLYFKTTQQFTSQDGGGGWGGWGSEKEAIDGWLSHMKLGTSGMPIGDNLVLFNEAKDYLIGAKDPASGLTITDIRIAGGKGGTKLHLELKAPSKNINKAVDQFNGAFEDSIVVTDNEKARMVIDLNDQTTDNALLNWYNIAYQQANSPYFRPDGQYGGNQPTTTGNTSILGGVNTGN